MRWHCPPDTDFEIRALTVWGRARYLSVTDALHNIELLRVGGEETFCIFETRRPEWGSIPRSPTFQAGSFNHGTKAPAHNAHPAQSGQTVRLPVWPWQQVCLRPVRNGGGESNMNIHYVVTGLLTVVWRSHSGQIVWPAGVGQGRGGFYTHSTYTWYQGVCR